METNENAKAEKAKKAAAEADDQKDEKPKLPTSWDEYCEQMKGKPSYMGETCFKTSFDDHIFNDEFADKETLEAYNALAKLLKLHKVWIGDWQPDWKTYKDEKYIIATKRGEIDLRSTWVNSSPMCFPTKGMRRLFALYFRELLEKAKPLL